MGNLTRPISGLSFLQRYKVSDPKLRKALFVAENIFDEEGRKFIFQLFA